MNGRKAKKEAEKKKLANRTNDIFSLFFSHHDCDCNKSKKGRRNDDEHEPKRA
jgi:hypothetical protein